MNKLSDEITTPLGVFSREKIEALTKVREEALYEFRDALKGLGYREATTSSLVNIAGSCENPNVSFTLNYYGREAHLSQSAQLQLEALVLRLGRGFFTVNGSFREEHFDDPEAAGRRLSEFTLIEAERPLDFYYESDPASSLSILVEEQKRLTKKLISRILNSSAEEIAHLGGNTSYLEKLIGDTTFFDEITYSQALEILMDDGFSLEFGADLGIREEQAILRYFNDIPTFVTFHPAPLKFFNAARTPDGLAYSVDLLTPKLGETIGGAVREQDANKIRQYLRESRVGQYLSQQGCDPEAEFREYFDTLEQEPPLLRGGYGIGFERFVAFLIGSNDILDTIAYRSLQPKRGD